MRAVSPWRRALREVRRLPAAVRGPVEWAALRRLAAARGVVIWLGRGSDVARQGCIWSCPFELDIAWVGTPGGSARVGVVERERAIVGGRVVTEAAIGIDTITAKCIGFCCW